MKLTRCKTASKQAVNITKSISMPGKLFQAAESRIKSDEELDWSKYIRRLIRKDLERKEAVTA